MENAANPVAQLNDRKSSKFCLSQVVELCFSGSIADSTDNLNGIAIKKWM